MLPRVVICASGEGSNFTAMVLASRAGSLPVAIAGLIVDRVGAPVIDRARREGVPHALIAPAQFDSRDRWDQAVTSQLQAWRADWVALAGYLNLVGPAVLAAFPGRVVNSHPALLPRFGGKGMYGDRVHAAVLAAGESETGVTIHLIDEVFDRGQIIAQAKVPVLAGDSIERLAERVKAREREFYPEVLARLVAPSLQKFTP